MGFTVVFVWLNVDLWIAGLPLTWIGSQPEIRYRHPILSGVPFPYEGLPPFPEWQWSALAIDVLIGLMGWAALYGTRAVTQRIHSRLT